MQLIAKFVLDEFGDNSFYEERVLIIVTTVASGMI